MYFGAAFFSKSFLLAIALSMDAFSVSLANGLNEPCMKKRKLFAVAGIFATFQALMPMIGWTCVRTIVQCFSAFNTFIPWIALILLLFIGGKMVIEGIKGGATEQMCAKAGVGFAALLLQGIATSIDALSVGFNTASYDLLAAFVSSLIIAAVTFIICIAGIIIGKKAATKLTGKAEILGGIILMFIGIEVFVSGVF